MIFNIITIFPQIFNSYFNESIIKRAQNKKIVKINIYDLRKWAKDKHKTVDDKPYGGGAGMVLMAEPICKALVVLRKSQAPNSKVVLLSAKGKKWNQQTAKRFAKLNNVTLICGRYEGVDERIKKFVDEEISIGDYVLTGGEIPAMIIVDSITRLLPGVLGNEESPKHESHFEAGILEHPHYTRPEILTIKGKKYKAPKVLLSGDHQKIGEWRKKKTKKLLN